MPDLPRHGEDSDTVEPKPPRWLRWLLAHAPRFLLPTLDFEPEPRDRQYVRSFMVMRIGSALLAFAIPLAVVAISRSLDDRPGFRGSLSEYYYTGAREVFVGGLCAMAVFLLSYKVVELSLENLLSALAALLLIGVVLLPTGLPEYITEYTPLQRKWTEERVETLHFVCAALFISLLALISFFFGVREAQRTKSGFLSPKFWRRFHWTCSLAILAAVGWLLGVVKHWWGGSHAILIGEWIAIYAFGASWLTKGFEYHYLFRRVPPPTRN